MDVLSDTLRVVRLTGAVFLRAKLTSPWAVESGTSKELAEYLRLPSDCLAVFHILAQGECWFSYSGSPPVLLRAGDAVLIPRSSPHVVGSVQGIIPVPLRSILPPLRPEGITEIEGPGLGETTRLVCGYLHCDQRFNPLLGALPEVIVIHPCDDVVNDASGADSAGAHHQKSSPVLSVQSGDWLETTMRHTVEEAFAERPGNSDMLARLSEILFVEVVRRYMQRLPAAHVGWLAGVKDPIVGQALRLLHEQPAYAWTVEDLARAVAVSRSTLAQRFTVLIGETPMRYLAIWRIQLAKYLLKQTSLNLVDVAERVGYESVVAFNRAFRRHVGQPPATWRIATDDPPLAAVSNA
jgi:AraC family transcriptional regulator, alkane utilization regulator